MTIRRIVFAGLFLILFPSFAFAGNLSFTKEDRILVVAPHPDDEALGAAGMIQSALEAGAEVKIVYLTHGESNELSALFYQKKPMLLKPDFVKIGRLRKEEAIEAMGLLGVPEKNLIFFGYPDLGTMPIWEKFWNSVKPFRSFFTRINKVIHEDDFSYGEYYRATNITYDFEKVILAARPTHIFVTAPFDLNLDHQAAYLFLETALFDVGAQLEIKPAVHMYLVHAHDWPKPRKYDPREELAPPSGKVVPETQWQRYELSLEKIQKKEKSILCYDSQLSYAKNFLLSFVRKNEIYADYLFENVAVETGLSADQWISRKSAREAGNVRYAANDTELLIEIPLVYALDEMGTLSTNIFGYRKGTPFAQMPKLNLKLFGNKLFIKDGGRSFFDRNIFFKVDKSRLFIRVPLSTLKQPDYLFVSTSTVKNQLSLDFGSWRVIEITKSTSTGQPATRQVV